MILYKKRLVSDESGLRVITDRYISIHETPCFHYCINSWNEGYYGLGRLEGESELHCAKRKHISVKRIHKTCSRFAFSTEEKAFKHLKMLKSRQAGHIKRDLKFIEKFLKTDTLDEKGHVVGSKGLVHEYFNFDC